MKQPTIKKPTDSTSPAQMDRFLTNFKGGNRIQRGRDWALKGGGSNTSTFLTSVSSISTSMVPVADNIYSIGSGSFRFANLYAAKLNNVTPRPGTLTVYVAASAGGAVTTALNINTGIIVT